MIDSPVVSVRLPPSLRFLAGGRSEVLASGDTVGEVLDSVGHEFPALSSHLVSPTGQLDDHLLIFLGSRCIASTEGLQTPIELEEVMSIVPA